MTEKTKSSLSKVAFTLIELLVVIAIIALLVSILLPSLNHAKYLARTAVCMSSLKSWGTVHAMYAAENDGNLITTRRLDPKSPELAHYEDFNRIFEVDYGFVDKNFLCPLNIPDDGKVENNWYTVYAFNGYTYLGAYDAASAGFFYNNYQSPSNLSNSESWWVVMTDRCRLWNNVWTNHLLNGEVYSNNILRVNGSVEQKMSGDFAETPNFDAGGGFWVWW